MSAAITRRAAITGTSMSAIAIASPAMSAPARISPGLAAALNRYRAADRRNSVFLADVFDPAEDAWREAREAVPHRTTTVINILEKPHSLSTNGPIEHYRKTLAGIETGGAQAGPDYERVLREVIVAADERNAAIVRVDTVRGMDALEEQRDNLADAAHDALAAVITYPVATIHDLRVKVEFLADDCAWEISAAQAAIVADVRRLAGGLS